MKPILEAAGNKKANSGGSTSSTEPWEPAQGLLKDVLKDTGDLRTYYQQNPFSDTQKTAYQNQFSQLDNFNNQVAPGLLKGFQGLLGPGFGDIASAVGPSAQNPVGSYGKINFDAIGPWGKGLLSAPGGANAPAQQQAAQQMTPAQTEEERRRKEEEMALLRYMENTSAGDGGGGSSGGSW